jgi:hypothetical protein
MIGRRLGLFHGFQGVVFVEDICFTLAAVDALALYPSNSISYLSVLS